MVTFFESHSQIYAVGSTHTPDPATREKLSWLFGRARVIPEPVVNGAFIGPGRK